MSPELRTELPESRLEPTGLPTSSPEVLTLTPSGFPVSSLVFSTKPHSAARWAAAPISPFVPCRPPDAGGDDPGIVSGDGSLRAIHEVVTGIPSSESILPDFDESCLSWSSSGRLPPQLRHDAAGGGGRKEEK
ncbi:mannitol-1-phosphate 5-dehydrogenase [Striga asiatica]|uniref:Mannitol-1-phosphate 5-dehydrogenase n=1 Tax=Striga asiatica TaxID=4170 RepID=A0A5A7NYM1_STRAF|nr:mannitol-1-phosphate 5-dehydrogenase [Striga asiatica]